MAKMLVCPKCGLYQEDTTTIRKTGVAAKKVALFAGQQVLKQGTKMAASFVGLDGEYSQRAAGMLGSEAAKAIGLDPSKASISDVKYKCSSCACYWEGLDVPTLFNQVQLDTVRQAREAKLEELRVNFEKSWKRIVYATIFVALSFFNLERSNLLCRNEFHSRLHFKFHQLFMALLCILANDSRIRICTFYCNRRYYRKPLEPQEG